jgi:hypothetical protein
VETVHPHDASDRFVIDTNALGPQLARDPAVI